MNEATPDKTSSDKRASNKPQITTEVQGRLFLIGLNRPEKRNAFSLQMLRELAQALTDYEAREELWCALLFAHGEHFTAGLDLGEVGPAVAGGDPLFPPELIDPFGLYGKTRSKPLICATQGWCLTIGLELALASDIRLAASDVRFGQIEIRRGIMPFGGATLRLPQIAGWGNAMRYLLTGDEFDATEAYRIGLIQEIVEPEQLFSRAIDIAETVARQAPLGVRASLASAHKALVEGHQAAAAELIEQARALMTTHDAFEGMMSFLERREARFQGK